MVDGCLNFYACPDYSMIKNYMKTYLVNFVKLNWLAVTLYMCWGKKGAGSCG